MIKKQIDDAVAMTLGFALCETTAVDTINSVTTLFELAILQQLQIPNTTVTLEYLGTFGNVNGVVVFAPSEMLKAAVTAAKTLKGNDHG